MKSKFWKARGLANSSSRLVLKRKPAINLLVSKTWMVYEHFFKTWMKNLNLNLFAMNSMNNLLPNLCCICKSYLDYVIISTDDQHVTFTLSENAKTYASQ